MVFAWDAHPDAGVADGITIINLTEDADHANPDSSRHLNDHCGHGAAHLVAIFYKAAMQIEVSDRDQYAFLASALPSPYISPPPRPPRV